MAPIKSQYRRIEEGSATSHLERIKKTQKKPTWKINGLKSMTELHLDLKN